jgi:response regulator of citrate/malate metabolism
MQTLIVDDDPLVGELIVQFVEQKQNYSKILVAVNFCVIGGVSA